MGAMDTGLTYGNHATLPEIAEVVAAAFPMLKGRAYPVTGEDFDEKVDRDLPMALVALHSGSSSNNSTLNQVINLTDDFIIEFIVKPTKYKIGNLETRLWQFYDYEKIRDTLFFHLREFSGRNNLIIRYVSVEMSSDNFGIYITFRFRQTFEWCELEDIKTEIEPSDLLPVQIRTTFSITSDEKECQDCSEEIIQDNCNKESC